MPENGRLLGAVVKSCACDRFTCISMLAIAGASKGEMRAEIAAKLTFEGEPVDLADLTKDTTDKILVYEDPQTGDLEPVDVWKIQVKNPGALERAPGMPPPPCKIPLN